MSFIKIGSIISAFGFGYLSVSSGPLTINGKSVQTNFVVVDGKTYAPLADVAKALNMTLVPDGSGFKIVPVGGANQVEGLNGKKGQLLNCGAFTLKVTDVIVTTDYKRKWSSGSEQPLTDGENVVVVLFHIKNAASKKQSFDVLGGSLTALTDGNDHSYTTTNWDGADRAPNLLPGAGSDFGLIYRFPKGAEVGDMVYQLHGYNPDTGYRDYTFRVSLKRN